jgi:hypothetical protein
VLHHLFSFITDGSAGQQNNYNNSGMKTQAGGGICGMLGSGIDPEALAGRKEAGSSALCIPRLFLALH